MPRLFQLKDKQTGKTITRHGRDTREILGMDPQRYSLVGDAKILPIRHEDRVRLTEEEEADLPSRRKKPPVQAAPAAPAPEPKREVSADRREKQVAAMAKARAAAAAKRAAKAAQSVA